MRQNEKDAAAKSELKDSTNITEIKPETSKPEEKKAPGIALPITEMTDDWMDDDVAIGSIESDEEEETPHTPHQGSTEETKIEEAGQQSDTSRRWPDQQLDASQANNWTHARPTVGRRP